MTQVPDITVEFYGIPRQRAGRSDLAVKARTVTELLRAVETACPDLTLLEADGRIAPHIRISVDGQRFVSDLGEELTPGARVLILSADVGG
jgi:molybdopterin converting factor small subunit